MLNKPREWTLLNERFQSGENHYEVFLAASGPSLERHEKVKVIEKTPLISAAPDLYEIVFLMSGGAITYEDPRVMAALMKARGES